MILHILHHLLLHHLVLHLLEAIASAALGDVLSCSLLVDLVGLCLNLLNLELFLLALILLGVLSLEDLVLDLLCLLLVLLLDLLCLLALFGLGGLRSLTTLLALLRRFARLSLLGSCSALGSNASSLLPGKLSFSGSLLLHLCKLDGSLFLLLLLLSPALLLISSLLNGQLALLLRILLLLNSQLSLLFDLGLCSLDLHGLILLQLSNTVLLGLLLGKHSFTLFSSFFGCKHALALSLLHLALLDGQLSLTLSLGLSTLDFLLLFGSKGSSSLLSGYCSVPSCKSLSTFLSLSSTLFGEHDVA